MDQSQVACWMCRVKVIGRLETVDPLFRFVRKVERPKLGTRFGRSGHVLRSTSLDTLALILTLITKCCRHVSPGANPLLIVYFSKGTLFFGSLQPAAYQCTAQTSMHCHQVHTSNFTIFLSRGSTQINNSSIRISHIEAKHTSTSTSN